MFIVDGNDYKILVATDMEYDERRDLIDFLPKVHPDIIK